MKPGVYNLETRRGDTFRRTVRLRERLWNPALNDGAGGYESGAYLDLTGYSAPKAQFRETKLDPTVALELTCTILTQSGDTLGGVRFYATDTLMSALDKASYVWDFEMLNPDGDRDTYLAGTVTNDLDVTHT